MGDEEARHAREMETASRLMVLEAVVTGVVALLPDGVREIIVTRLRNMPAALAPDMADDDRAIFAKACDDMADSILAGGEDA